jgi:hypothetical protein
MIPRTGQARDANEKGAFLSNRQAAFDFAAQRIPTGIPDLRKAGPSRTLAKKEGIPHQRRFLAVWQWASYDVKRPSSRANA